MLTINLCQSIVEHDSIQIKMGSKNKDYFPVFTSLLIKDVIILGELLLQDTHLRMHRIQHIHQV
ncbi:MAG: hypothetical protein LBG80_08985 [Bacteroidales bacterium]|nr:hypothetical protein [Bacteroidales bacterium]